MKLGKIISLERNVATPKKAGGTYQAALLTVQYEGEATPVVKKLSEQGLAHPNSADLNTKLSQVQPGQEVGLIFTKSGQFMNLTDLELDATVARADYERQLAAVAKRGPSGGSSSSSFGGSDNLGMQVGNALTNASTLLANKVVTGTLEEVAVQVLKTGESLKARLAAGEFAATKPLPQDEKPTVTATGVVEQDIPWTG